MENTNNASVSTNTAPVFRDQLLTVSDLLIFKEQLINEIKDILTQQPPPSPPKLDKQWLKAFEIKKLLRLSSGKLQYLRDKGVIPFKKLGNVTYYDLEKIQDLMENETFKQRLKLA
ncbi:helix-turn-helix domain-containing protein [Pedobacter sp. P351]|uniref:helix-turn-helix domain-containing protein n=1 Tax=Pedobacter superstes TaxID=3133441 RepID=UPI0030B52512